MQALEASQGLEDLVYGSAASLPLTQVLLCAWPWRGHPCACVRVCMRVCIVFVSSRHIKYRTNIPGYGVRGAPMEQEQLDAAINQMAHLDTSTCEEKAHAALALAAVARAARHHLADFVDDAIRVLHAVAVAFQPAIRQAAFPALAACVSASLLAFSKPIQQSGPPSAVSTVLHAATESHADAAIVTCMLALDDDADAETVARAFDCLSSVTHDVGWSFLHVYLARLSCLLASPSPPRFPLPPIFLSSPLLSSSLLANAT
jgi:hypothetical protein